MLEEKGGSMYEASQHSDIIREYLEGGTEQESMEGGARHCRDPVFTLRSDTKEG